MLQCYNVTMLQCYNVTMLHLLGTLNPLYLEYKCMEMTEISSSKQMRATSILWLHTERERKRESRMITVKVWQKGLLALLLVLLALLALLCCLLCCRPAFYYSPGSTSNNPLLLLLPKISASISEFIHLLLICLWCWLWSEAPTSALITPNIHDQLSPSWDYWHLTVGKVREQV